jgi:hypothetical protein
MSKPALERLHDLIRTAQLDVDRNASAPVVADAVIDRYRRFILGDEAILDHALKYGLLGIVQRLLKRKGISGGMGRNLELWPERVRTLVAEIADIAVFDPVSGEYIDLDPEMEPDEIERSARAIMTHGEDCLRKGRLMLRLADRLRKLKD